MEIPTNELTTMFGSELPFSIFRKDLNQYSFTDLKDEDSKAFLWHQFMLDVLLNIPRSPTDNENIIAACRRVSELDTTEPFAPGENDIDTFRTTYQPDKAIDWYTRDSFLYRAFNKACRIVEGDAIVQFHSFIKDINGQLNQLHLEQSQNKESVWPMTVYRGQARWNMNEFEKLLKSQGNLISMNTFLSTTTNCAVATQFLGGADRSTSVLFQITINDPKNNKQLQTFAHINQYAAKEDEKEVLFGMSSVFKVNSIEEYDCFWIIDLELTDYKQDEYLQKFMNEIKTCVYQMSGKQIPFIIFKKLFTTTTDSYARPLTELMKFTLTDIMQLFVINFYKKNLRMKELIDQEADLITVMTKTTGELVCSSELSICLLFDLFNKFLYDKDKIKQEKIFFDTDDKISLICFGCMLLLTGECNKSIRYFNMLLENKSIDDKLKLCIRAISRAIYVLIDEKEVASTYEPIPLEIFESSMKTSTSSWFTTLIASSNIPLFDSNESINQMLNRHESILNKKYSDNDIGEKLRLFILSSICVQQENFIDTLNHLEDALEIPFYLNSLFNKFVNGLIYMQIAAIYLRLNNIPNAIKLAEKSKEYVQSYFPPTHRLFVNFNIMYGYYSILNEKSIEAIQYFNKALENPYFPNNIDSFGTIYTLMAIASMQSGNMESTEEYCHKALEYSAPTNISTQVPYFLQAIPAFKDCIDRAGTIAARLAVRQCLKHSQQLLSTMIPNSIIPPNVINDATCTSDKYIDYGDYYRHRRKYKNAELYYMKALEKMTEKDSKSVWNVFKKLMRMGNNIRYRDYFIQQYSKYDDNNLEHLEIIATLQIIMYKLCFLQNEFELGFDCLISGIIITLKIFYHRMNIDSNYISNIYDNIFYHSEISRACAFLTKFIKIYSTNLIIYIQYFLSIYFTSDDLYVILAKIIHHSHIDSFLDRIKLKYGNNQFSISIILFLDTLLQILRQCITVEENSIISFGDQILEFVAKYNDDENMPLFYLMKILEALVTNNTQDFLFNLDKFQRNIITFDCYKKFKDKISNFFEKLDEDALHLWLNNIAQNL